MEPIRCEAIASVPVDYSRSDGAVTIRCDRQYRHDGPHSKTRGESHYEWSEAATNFTGANGGWPTNDCESVSMAMTTWSQPIDVCD
jgi:hypothetical protein